MARERVQPIQILLSCPKDADWIMEQLRVSLEMDWRRGGNAGTDLRIDTVYWREDSAHSWSLDGGQGVVNETLVERADLVIAVFIRDVGSSWTSDITGDYYPSGTAAEIELGSTRGRHARIYAASSEYGDDKSGEVLSGPWAGPSGRTAELQQLLTDYSTRSETDRAGAWFIREFDNYEHLREWIWKDISFELGPGGGIKLPEKRIDVTRQTRTLELPTSTYVHRAQEDQIRQVWSGGKTRVSLFGDGGVGKSFIARRIYADALVEPAVMGTCQCFRRLGLRETEHR